MKKKLLLSIVLSTCLYSQEVVEATNISKDVTSEQSNTPQEFVLNLEYIKTLPQGLKRDFFINQYFKKNITPDEAYTSLSLLSNMTNNIFINFAKAFKDDETLAVAQCLSMDSKELVDSYADCIVSSMDLNTASKLSAVDLQIVYQKTKDKYPTFADEIKILSSSIPFTKLIVQKKELFYSVFLGVSSEFREKYFDYKLPSRTFSRILEDKTKFQSFLKTVLLNPDLKILPKTLLDLDDSDFDSNSSFYLAVNAIRFKDFNKAYTYLENAKNKAENIYALDKINFYIYLITKDESILKSLSNKSTNIYTFLAKEFLNKNSTFILDKYDFLDSLIETSGIKRVSFLYAYSKIASDFNNQKISNNLKIGLMQIDLDSLNKVLKDYSLPTLFNASENLQYANAILNTLKNKDTNIFDTYYSYSGKQNPLLKISNEEFSKDFDLYKLAYIFNKKDEDFILNFVLYYNSFEKDEEKKLKLFSIFETLFQPHLKEDVKALD